MVKLFTDEYHTGKYLNKLTLTIPLTPASSRASRQAASVTVSSSSHPP